MPKEAGKPTIEHVKAWSGHKYFFPDPTKTRVGNLRWVEGKEGSHVQADFHDVLRDKVYRMEIDTRTGVMAPVSLSLDVMKSIRKAAKRFKPLEE
jgi:hypothetical protein